MDLVRKISICLELIVLVFSVVSCKEHSGVEPEWNYRVFSFKKMEYKGNVLCDNSYGKYALFSYSQGVKDSAEYVELHESNLICNNSWVPLSCAVSSLKWKDYDFSSHPLYFSAEEIIDSSPFKSYYLIPEHIIGIPFFSYPIDKNAVAAINAMIDDGSIEQYRVDLGY